MKPAMMSEQNAEQTEVEQAYEPTDFDIRRTYEGPWIFGFGSEAAQEDVEEAVEALEPSEADQDQLDSIYGLESTDQSVRKAYEDPGDTLEDTTDTDIAEVYRTLEHDYTGASSEEVERSVRAVKPT